MIEEIQFKLYISEFEGLLMKGFLHSVNVHFRPLTYNSFSISRPTAMKVAACN